MHTLRQLSVKITLACLLVIGALVLPVLIFERIDLLAGRPAIKYLVISCLVGFIAIAGIWLLRKKDQQQPAVAIGLLKPGKAIKHFVLGFSLIALPLLISFLAGDLLGWTNVILNTRGEVIWSLLIALVSIFFTDAIAEELVFRGYIFSNLKTKYNTWTSSVITVVLFVTVPVIIMTLKSYLGLSSAVELTGGYVITLIFFGSFMQYLRVLTKSIWAGVGFHLFFVFMNQLMSPTENTLIQFTENSNEQLLQITLVSLLLLVFLGLIFYPIIKKRRANSST